MLGLSNNRLESLPDGLGHLPALVKLDISTNNLRHLPPSLGKLRRVQRIDAANNMLVRDAACLACDLLAPLLPCAAWSCTRTSLQQRDLFTLPCAL